MSRVPFRFWKTLLLCVRTLVSSNLISRWPVLTYINHIEGPTSLRLVDLPCSFAMSSLSTRRFELDLRHTQITLFNVLAFLGVFSIILVLAPALFSSHVKRSRAWFGVLTAWMLYSATYLLLIGRQLDPEPPYGLCMLQAALVYATTPL